MAEQMISEVQKKKNSTQPPQSVKLTLEEWIKSITASSIMNNPQVFTEFMEVCSDVERGADMQGLFHSQEVNMNQCLKGLAKRRNFDSTFNKDVFFYILIIHRAKRIADSVYSTDCVNGLLEEVVSKLKDMHPQEIKHAYDDLMSVWSTENTSCTFFPSIYKPFKPVIEMLSESFPTFCESWLTYSRKHKKESYPEGYLYVAILCVTLSLKLCLRDDRNLKPKPKMWNNLVVEPAHSTQMSQTFLHEVRLALELLEMFKLPQEHMINVNQLQSIAAEGPNGRVRTIFEVQNYFRTIDEYCLKYWSKDVLLTEFLRPQRKAYKTAIKGKLWPIRKGRITDLTNDGTVVSVIDMGTRFLLGVYCSERYEWKHTFDKECSKWLHMFLELVDFSDSEAVRIVGTLSNFKTESESGYSKVVVEKVNEHFLQALPNLTGDVSGFIAIYNSAMDVDKFWKSEVLTEYVKLVSSKKLPDDLELCREPFKSLITLTAKRLKDKFDQQLTLLLPLIKNAAQCYSKRNVFFDFLAHLFQLDNPDLFALVRVNDGSLSPEPLNEFQTFLKSYIEDNNISSSILSQIDVLLHFTSTSTNPFQSSIITVILEVVFSNGNLQQKVTTQLISHALMFLTNILDSARTRFVMGILRCVASRINPSSSNLQWLKSHGLEVVKLAEAYQNISQIECLKIFELDDASFSALLQKYPTEVGEFFNFILKVKAALHKWSEKLQCKQLTPSNLKSMQALEPFFEQICTHLPSVSVSVEDISRVTQDYNSLQKRLMCLLVREVPGSSELGQCSLKLLLQKHKLKLEVQFVDIFGSGCTYNEDVENTTNSLCQLEVMADDIERFLQPMLQALDVLVFFELNPSNLFTHILNKFKNDVVPKLHTSESVSKEDLKNATEEAVSLVWKICQGNATVLEVKLNDSLPLECINVEDELRNLSLFAELFAGQFNKTVQRCEGLYGIPAFLKLLQTYEGIFTIGDICKQFNLLVECQTDKDLQILVEIAEELNSVDRRQALTMTEAIDKFSMINEKLQIRQNSIEDVLKLFNEVKNSAAFFTFADEQKFTGPSGKSQFIIRHRLVTTLLQHEEYKEVVLDHLFGCFDYVEPFLVKPSSFKDLMERIASPKLSNIDNGMKQLRTVNRNIALVKLWFEGESFENTSSTLSSILKTGKFYFNQSSIDELCLQFTHNEEIEESLNEAICRKWSLQQMEEFAVQVRFLLYEETKQHDQIKKYCEVYLGIHKKVQKLSYTLQKLRALQIQTNLYACMPLRCSHERIGFLDDCVERANSQLLEWQEETSVYRGRCKWLAFFSNMKLLQLYNSCASELSEQTRAEIIVNEISIIFHNDLRIHGALCKYVKMALQDVRKILFTLPFVKYAETILNKVFEYDQDIYVPKRVTLVHTSPDQASPFHGSLYPRHFILHFVPNLTHKQHIQFLCNQLFQRIPFPFELLCCTDKTTGDELQLFFQRIAFFSNHKYVIINANLLSADIQEVLVGECMCLLDSVATKKDSTFLKLNFVESGRSFLSEMPWITVIEHKDLTELTTSDAIYEWGRPIVAKENFRMFQLVQGKAGDGKTHYVRKELRKGWHREKIIVSVNECFDPVEIIKILRETQMQRYVALFLNFTLPRTEDFENENDKREFQKLYSDINWFFFSLFIIGYVEDFSSGLSFRLPGGLQWSVFVEVPSWDEDAHKSMELFNEVFPTFHYLADVVPIDCDIPFDVEGDVKLVCQYLKAKKMNNLDHWFHRKEKYGMPYSIAKIVGDISPEECGQLMKECLPDIVKKRKIIQRLYMKYMERRCRILEGCKALQLNEGVGEPIHVEGKPDRLSDIRHLRSLLFKLMEKEVLNFCDRKDTLEESHQQLIYDGGNSFKFISLKPDKIPPEDKEQLEKVGIDIPSIIEVRERSFLCSCLSHALDIQENNLALLIDEHKYVMTLDYAVKMLSVHERSKCGVPVIINGETGVGKTFLLEMLSLLWNQPILSAINQQKSTFQELLMQKLEEHDTDETKEVLDALKNNKRLHLEQLEDVLDLSDLKEPSKRLYDVLSAELLDRQYSTTFALIEFPTDLNGNGSILNLFQQVSSRNRSEVLNATARIFLGILISQPRRVFRKLCIHAALTPANIQKFFEDVQCDAERIIAWCNFCSKNQTQDRGVSLFSVPTITVFLDEVNTASCPGFIKGIITDRILNGKDISPNIFIVAACNPHRGNSLAILEGPGLAENWFTGSYRVRPFHDTLNLLMWDYGALGYAQEKEYIRIKMDVVEKELSATEKASLAQLISKSQQLIREYASMHLVSNKFDKDVAWAYAKSSVSQRDIQRVFIIYGWLKQSFAILGRHKNEDEGKERFIRILWALLVALAVVYYFRLNATGRDRFCKDISKAIPVGWSNKLNNELRLKHGLSDRDFEKPIFKLVLDVELEWMINVMKLPSGVAKTEALKENIYATVVCTMTRIPLIIAGQPGSSKTLSFKIVTSNLFGKSSPVPTFRECRVFKALVPHFYQCSPKSSSIEIETVFKKAINRQDRLKALNDDNLSVVLMDEAGLPEESHESLKVLHYYLDDQVVAFVGISNHILDAAKMNRAVSLFRPDASQSDVQVLAKGCLYTNIKDSEDNVVEGFSLSYLDVMQDGDINVDTFFGLRDFIYFCAHLRRKREIGIAQRSVLSPQRRVSGNYKLENLTPELVVESLERNFNGSEHFKTIRHYFFERVFKIGLKTVELKGRNVLDVLRESLADHPRDLSAENEVRYKLIIDSSEDESLVRLLFSFKVLDRKKTRLYVCSRFLCDAENEKLGVVAAIKHSASQGHTVLLSQIDSIQECFYDLFNQRFACTEDATHGKRFYANVTIGSYVKPCPVHCSFQCVVVIKKSAISQTPPAFLNRFEKYALSHHLLLKYLLKSLPFCLREIILGAQSKVCAFLKSCGSSCFYGQTPETLDSLLLTVLPNKIPSQSTDSQCTISRPKTKMAKVLACLEWGLQYYLGFKFSLSAAIELDEFGIHLFKMLEENNILLADTFKMLEESNVPELLQIALSILKQQEPSQQPTDSNITLVHVLFQQWLVMHLYKRLMQLMTPEALVTNYKKIPPHYISHYLNYQCHFNLKALLVRYHTEMEQELNSSVQGNTLFFSNKILCYCRSSHYLHNIPQDWSTDDSKKEFIQEHVFPDAEKLSIFKITSFTTQKSITELVKGFVAPVHVQEILLLVANIEDVPINAINHIRIIIEENEAIEKLQFPKLIVLLMHFPSQYFFNHCYPSYFLQGWDHYYLDTISPGSKTASIDIQRWFSECFTAEGNSGEATGSFMKLEYVDNLLKEALPLVSLHIALRDKGNELSATTKNRYLNEILFERGVNRVIFELFATYWQPDVMIDKSEKASYLACSCECSLSITDAVNTIIKTSLYDFLLYVLSLLNDCQAIMLVVSSDRGSEIEKLVLKILMNYPYIPKNLSEVKMQSVQLGKLTGENSNSSLEFNFPFFNCVYDIVEELLNQSRRDVASKLNLSVDREGWNMATDIKDIQETMVDLLEKRLTTRYIEDTASKHGNIRKSEINVMPCLNAVFNAMKYEDIWERYVKDFCTPKLSLGAKSTPKRMPVEQFLITDKSSSMERRTADLHVCVRLHDFDKESLTLTRFRDALNSYQAREPCGSIITTLQKPVVLFELVINGMYNDLLEMSTAEKTSDVNNVVKDMSSNYLQMMRLPTIQGITMSETVKVKWDIIHTVLLLLHCDEILPEFAVSSVLQNFVFFNSKIFYAEARQTSIPLGTLAQQLLKFLFQCPKDSLQQVIGGLLEHFFSSCETRRYSDEDVFWFLKLFEEKWFSEIFSSRESGIQLLKYHLTKILSTKNPTASPDAVNPLGIFDDKPRSLVSAGIVDCSGATIQPKLFLPDFYQQCGPLCERNEHLLLNLYFAITLEKLRLNAMQLPHVMDLLETVSQKLLQLSADKSTENYILLEVEKQALLHILLEKLADQFYQKEEEIADFLEIDGKVDTILSESKPNGLPKGGYGSMLVVHLLRKSRSVRTVRELLGAQFSVVCGRCACLLPFHTIIHEEGHSKSSRSSFPIILDGDKTSKERNMYSEIRKLLSKFQSTRNTQQMSKLLGVATTCYTGGEQKSSFNMVLLLCSYYSYFCRSGQEDFAELAEEVSTNLKQLLDKRLLDLVKCFINKKLLTSCKEQLVISGTHKIVDPLFDFFINDADADTIAMRDALVHLAAVVVGSTVEYTNLWYHMFSPEDLKGSYIPGFIINAPCGNDPEEVFYDSVTTLSEQGILRSREVQFCTSGSLNLQSRYFMLWANYGALCISLLIDPLRSKRLEKVIFTDGLPLRHHCLTRAKQMWKLLSDNMNITVEERVAFVNNCLENYYLESRKRPSCLASPGICCTQETSSKYEEYLHKKCFLPAWKKINATHSVVYQDVCAKFGHELRTLDEHYPESVNPEFFLLQILSSTSLHDETGSHFVLYQFILKRPLLNAGGRLLPTLIDFYQWLHESFAYIKTAEKAREEDINVSLSIFLKNHSGPTLRDKWQKTFHKLKEEYRIYSELSEHKLPPIADHTKLIDFLSVAEEELKGENILYNTIIRIVKDYNDFLHSALTHNSLAKIWRYFSNYETEAPLPLLEVTVDTCCFGSSTSLDDLSDMMHLLSKCCCLTRSSACKSFQLDPTLLHGCVPQVYNLEQLQEDIARQFLAGKQHVQNPEAIYRRFYFDEHSQYVSVSSLFLQCSVIDLTDLMYLPKKFQEELDQDLVKVVRYEFHTFWYHTLLEVIFGLNGALRHLRKKILQSGDHNLEQFRDQILEEFLADCTGCDNTTDILKEVGIYRINQTTGDVSVKESQYVVLKKLKMTKVFKVLKLLVKWMRLGMYEFSSLPFATKVEMQEDDRTRLRSIRQIHEGKSFGLFSELKTLTELLVQCERAIVNCINKRVEEVAIKQILKEEVGATVDTISNTVMGCISDRIQAQHYVDLRLELRRLQEKIRRDFTKETGKEMEEKPWEDWVASSKTTTKDKESDKANCATPSDQARDDTDSEAVQDVKEPGTHAEADIDTTRVLCSLPSEKSPNECKKLEKLGSCYKEFVKFLKEINLPECAKCVEDNYLDGGDMIVEFDDDVLKEYKLSNAVDRLCFRVLFQRELLQQTPQVAIAFPVEEVATFFSSIPLLQPCAPAILKNKIDGEMLLLAGDDVMKELGVSKAGIKLVRKQFRALVLAELP